MLVCESEVIATLHTFYPFSHCYRFRYILLYCTMTRKDTINNKTIGETLLHFCGCVATHQRGNLRVADNVIADAMTRIYFTLFTGKYSDFDGAMLLEAQFMGLVDNLYTVSKHDLDFYKELGTLCREYAETIYHLHNEEAEIDYF